MRPKKTKTNDSINSLDLVPQIYDQSKNETVTEDHLLALERSTHPKHRVTNIFYGLKDS